MKSDVIITPAFHDFHHRSAYLITFQYIEIHVCAEKLKMSAHENKNVRQKTHSYR